MQEGEPLPCNLSHELTSRPKISFLADIGLGTCLQLSPQMTTKTQTIIRAWRIWKCKLHMQAGKSAPVPPRPRVQQFFLPATAPRDARLSVRPCKWKLGHSPGSPHPTQKVLTGYGVSGSRRLAEPPLQHPSAHQPLPAPSLLCSARGWKTVYLFMDSLGLGSGFVSVNREEIQSVNGGC